MTILLTGANGQLGQALQIVLTYHQVVALAHDQIDITRLDQVLAAVHYYQLDLAINAAAFNDVDGAESRCGEAFRVNALGPRNLALATAAQGCPLLHLSTDYVFAGTSRGHTMNMNVLVLYPSMALASWRGKKQSEPIIRDTTSSAPPGSIIPPDAISRKRCVAWPRIQRCT